MASKTKLFLGRAVVAPIQNRSLNDLFSAVHCSPELESSLGDNKSHTWVRGPHMAIERWYPGVGVLNGEVWAIGGRQEFHFMKLTSCERLDAVTGTWMPGPEMAMPRALHGVVVLGGGSCGSLLRTAVQLSVLMRRPNDVSADRTTHSHDILSPSRYSGSRYGCWRF